MDNIPNEGKWQRPFTIQRYINTPYTEDLVTMFADGKIMFKDVDCFTSGFTSDASGVKVLLGDKYEEIDFKKIKYNVDKEGVPVHSFNYKFNKLDILYEAFCDNEISNTAYVKVALTNTTDKDIKEKISVIARTGLMSEVMCGNISGYFHFNTNPRIWGFIKTYFTYENGVMQDDSIKITFDKNLKGKWHGDEKGMPNYLRGFVEYEVEIKANSTTNFIFKVERPKKVSNGLNYEEERAKVYAFWLKELECIEKYPGRTKKQYYTMIRTLVSNSLQMFATEKNTRDILPRQGGTQTVIWPTEARSMLIGLVKIGDFDRYIDRVIDLYLDKLQVKEGENKGQFVNLGASVPWSSITYAILNTLADYALLRNEDKFKKFRPAILDAVDWIERARHKNEKYPGLMPAMRATDWAEIAHFWGADHGNICAYKKLITLFEHYNDYENANKIKGYLEEYTKIFKEKVVDKAINNFDDGDELFVPLTLEDLDKPLKLPYTNNPYLGNAPSLAMSGMIDHMGETIKHIENYFTNRGLHKNGLHGLMNCLLLGHNKDDPWAGHMWYTGFVDQGWFNLFMKQGRYDEAKIGLDAQIKYSMSKEYIMLERFMDNDKYFCCWQPNASANGRTLEMLLDYYSHPNTKK